MEVAGQFMQSTGDVKVDHLVQCEIAKWLGRQIHNSVHLGNPILTASNVHFWPIASFRCDTEFGRDRGKADIDQAAPIKLD
jgi:hypothetical protein